MHVHMFRKPIWCMYSPLGGEKPSWDWLNVCVDCPYPSLTPYHMTGVLWELPTPSLVGIGWPIKTEFWARICQFPELLSHGPVTSLIGSHQSLSSSTTIPPSSSPWERVSRLLLRLSLCFFWVSFLDCLQLFPTLLWNLDFYLQECSSWVGLHFCGPASCLAITRTIWSEWTRAWWSPELVLRLLPSDNKKQPPPPNHLEKLLI
jgi:hypothetical protein